MDWATAEALAVGTLLSSGVDVRFCGQDSQRGTFSHRHAVFTDQTTGKRVNPFASGVPTARYDVLNSPLSELAVVGFEYGHSVLQSPQHPRHLTVWEAQFGDFFNGAQVVVDTFVAGGWPKWRLASNLTLLLPHGYDGAGPEHSSCRLERFLQLTNHSTTDPNMRVCFPTTPSQYYHLLREQAASSNVPLIIATPKTLLRLAECTSPLGELACGSFQPVLESGTALVDAPSSGASEASSVILCTGKIFYDVQNQLKQAAKSAKLVRLEQLHPFPQDAIQSHISHAKSVIWCQEEPQNQGAYAYVQSMLPNRPLKFVGRKASGVPATGFPDRHKAEMQQLWQDLLRALL